MESFKTAPRDFLSTGFCIPQRVVLGLFGFLAIVNAYTMRISLSVAITVMVNKTVSNESVSKTGEGICPRPEGGLGSSSGPERGEFDWSESLQGLILSAFYFGYVITHLPGGLLAEKFGGKWTLCLGILSTAIFTLITPVCVYSGGPYALLGLRVLMGLGEGTTFPALSVLLAAWTPLKERSKLGALVLGGGQVGTILGTIISGFLIDHFKHWSPVFYFFGGLGLLWCLLFALLCYSDPFSHPFISDKEKDYLQEQLGRLQRDKNLPPVPWKHIFTSSPMIALICAQIGHDWGFFIMVTDLPKYMADVLQFSIKNNGLYSCIPYLVMWLVSISSGFLADWLITAKILGITAARKLFTVLAAVGPAIFIVGASYAGCDQTLVIVLFTIAMGIMGFFYPGMKVNPLDLSPNYAGTLMALTNGIGAITGIIVPYMVGLMTPNTTVLEWRLVFWIAFAIFVVTSIVYIIWGSGKTQPWDNPTTMEDTEKGKLKQPKE